MTPARAEPHKFVDFDRDIRDLVLTTLPCATDARAELEAESTSSLLIEYFNWYCRVVPAQRRRVHKSEELKRKVPGLAAPQRRAIRKIEDDISRGRDLSPHLSRSIRHGYLSKARVPEGRKARRDRDLLLYDWGLHHLHLSERVEKDGFVRRTKDLLFAGFLARDAYLIDIAPHGAWYLRRLLETVVTNWPDADLLVPLEPGLRVTTTFSEAEGLRLREAGVAANMFESHDRVWMPRDSLTTAGTSMRATRRADFILAEAERLEALLQSDPGPILDEVEKAAGAVSEPRLVFLIDGHRYGILEESSGVFLVIGTLSE